MATSIKITPEVHMTETKYYLVRIDGEEAAFVHTLEDVRLVIDSLAASEVKRLESTGYTSVYRQDIDSGNKIIVSTKGEWFGGIHPKVQIDFVPVGDKIYAVHPDKISPFSGAAELSHIQGNRFKITKDNGYAHYGEEVIFHFDNNGIPEKVSYAGISLYPKKSILKTLPKAAA